MTAGPSQFTGLLHHSLIIADLATTRHFHEEIVGLKLDNSRPEMNFAGLWYHVGDQAIHCLKVGNPDPVNGRPEHGGRDRHVALGIRDISPLIQRLEQHGIAFTRSRSGRAAIFFRDPDGNAIEVVEST